MTAAAADTAFIEAEMAEIESLIENGRRGVRSGQAPDLSDMADRIVALCRNIEAVTADLADRDHVRRRLAEIVDSLELLEREIADRLAEASDRGTGES